MSDRASPISEVSQDSTLFGRMKQAVGLTPKEHRLDIEEHETDVSPHAEDVVEKRTTKERTYFEQPARKSEEEEMEVTPPHAGKLQTPFSAVCKPSVKEGREGEIGAPKAAATPPTTESEATIEAPPSGSRVGVTKLLKPQEVEVGMEKPKFSTSEELDIEPDDFVHVHPSSNEYSSTRPHATTLQSIQETTPTTTGVGAAPATPMLRGEHAGDAVPAKVIADLEARGFRRVGGGYVTTHGRKEEEEERYPRQPTQGERVKVGRLGGGVPTPRAQKGGVEEVYARPDFEVVPLGAGEVAGMKAKEHEIVAKEASSRAKAKHAELMELRRQAKALEEQSTVLMQEAEAEKQRVETARERIGEIEHGEWRGYAQAERAETERRAAVERAKPAARTAEAREREAMIQKQRAADAEFHAQVLENRARALLRESQEMAALSLDLTAEAAKIAGQLTVARQEAEELKAQIDTHAARGLPAYIQECQKEMGVLSHRIMQLREEIAWAEEEMDRGRAEADTWRRVVVAKESQAARLQLTLTQLSDDAEEARHRSKAAAEEARIPTELAEEKYEEAWAAAAAAEEAEEEAKAAQHEALEQIKEAIGPEQERQRALREAAASEAAVVQLETKAEVVSGKAKRRLYEAEVKAQTAVEKAEKAERLEHEEEMEIEVKEAEEKMAEAYRGQQKEHRPIEVPAI